jgi:hypothetical protein
MKKYLIEESFDFAIALIHLNNGGMAQREIVKNETVIMIYKNRFYQYSLDTGIRYPYSPTNKDLQAKDWKLIFVQSNDSIIKLKNILLKTQLLIKDLT